MFPSLGLCCIVWCWFRLFVFGWVLVGLSFGLFCGLLRLFGWGWLLRCGGLLCCLLFALIVCLRLICGLIDWLVGLGLVVPWWWFSLFVGLVIV